MADRLQFDIDLEPYNNINIYDKNVIEKAIVDNQEELYPYLYRLIDNGDSRLEIQDNSLIVNDIQLSGDDGHADVSYGWGYYMGCKDMNSEGDSHASFDFTLNNGSLSFDIELPPAWRPDDYMG